MSFGFAVGDFIAVGDLALRLYKDVYKVSRTAPTEVRELAKELGVLSSSIQVLTEEAQSPESVLVRSGETRVNMVKEMISNTKETLDKLELYAKKHELVADQTTSRPLLRRTWDKLKYSKDANTINSLRARITYHCGVINLLLTSIGNSSLERLQSESQSIARNQEEVLHLLRTLTVDARIANQHWDKPLSTPTISAEEADLVKDELTQEFLKGVETTEGCTWMEIGIADWIEGGLRWLREGVYHTAKLDLLKRQDVDLSDQEDVYRSALTALLKASWIVMDVLRDHPARPFLTSNDRKRSIANLANDVTSELKILRELKTSAELIATPFDLANFESEGGQAQSYHGYTLYNYLSTYKKKNGPEMRPPRFDCLADVTLLGERSAMTCLFKIEPASENEGLQVHILTPGGYHIRLDLENPETELNSILSRPSLEMAEGEEAVYPFECRIMSEQAECGPIISSVRDLDFTARNVPKLIISIQDPIDDIVITLRQAISSRLRLANQHATHFLQETSLHCRKPLETVYNIGNVIRASEIGQLEQDDKITLIELVAKRCLLGDFIRRLLGTFPWTSDATGLVTNGYLSRPNLSVRDVSYAVANWLDEIDRVIRASRWWSRFEGSPPHDGLDLNDEELADSAEAWLQPLYLDPGNVRKLILQSLRHIAHKREILSVFHASYIESDEEDSS